MKLSLVTLTILHPSLNTQDKTSRSWWHFAWDPIFLSLRSPYPIWDWQFFKSSLVAWAKGKYRSSQGSGRRGELEKTSARTQKVLHRQG